MLRAFVKAAISPWYKTPEQATISFLGSNGLCWVVRLLGALAHSLAWSSTTAARRVQGNLRFGPREAHARDLG